MLLQRNRPGDQERGRELLARSASMAERFAMPELARRATELSASLLVPGEAAEKPAM
jgi:hypothetical protein